MTDGMQIAGHDLLCWSIAPADEADDVLNPTRG